MAYREHRRAPGSALDGDVQAKASSPGKRTLTSQLPAVQARSSSEGDAAGGGGGDGSRQDRSARGSDWFLGSFIPPASGQDEGSAHDRAHEVAEGGVAGSSGQLPHLDTIQQSFGDHDVSGVQAHTDARAGEAAGALDARAYATGNHVAFAGAPDLHTAAHEAAHVVQQRAGVQLKGGLGQSGDEYERNADAVADRVVSGRSAADLLPPAGQAGPGRGDATQTKSIQRRRAAKDGGKAAAAEIDYSAATNELRAAADIVQNRSRRLIGSAPGHEVVLGKLYAAATGRGDDGKDIDGRARLQLLDAAMAGLRPAIAALGAEAAGRAWLDENLDPGLASLRTSIQYDIASRRVQGATKIGEHAVIEDNPENARENTALLREQIKKSIGTLVLLNEQAIRFGEHQIEHQAEKLLEGHAPVGGKSMKDAGLLTQLQGTLLLVDGWLTLTDEELPHHLREIHGVFNGVSTYAHLAKGVVELLGGTVSVSASFASVIAKMSGQAAYAAQAAGLARMAAMKLSNVVTAVEVVYGLAVLLDPHATPEKKDEALLSVGTGVAWWVGKRIGGAAMGATASTAVLGGYLELKLMAHLYWSATYNILGGWMSNAFASIKAQGESIATTSEELAKAGILLEHEKDPEQRRALARVQDNAASGLGTRIDHFIDDCEPHGYGVGAAYFPGAYKILREVFAPIMGLRGKKTPADAATAGAAVLDRIVWCLNHQKELLDLSAHQKGLDALPKNDGQGEGGHGGGQGGGSGEGHGGEG
ncbi:MAG TPA: DUF4157 domain-containing protein [Kofleriaceae bacterium]|nr:DUF4157 domain-containing protein [Kofleriaceae bacterium]